MCALDPIFEGLLWMPLGFWSYPGGHGIMFNDGYHKFVLEEMISIGFMFTGLSALRHFATTAATPWPSVGSPG